MSDEKIWLSPPHMGDAELELVKKAFVSNWVAPAGPDLDLFEQSLAAYAGSDVSVAALSSGTAAIHLALLILGVKKDDEVLCSSFTFAGSCNPVAYVGARPVFVDSEADTWNMDPALLRTAIDDRFAKTGRKPKAIIVVHLYGMPSRMDEIMNIAREFEIPVIEDAAEALGSVYKGRKCGSIGDFGIFSFNGNKIITTSGGGALVSKNKHWIERAKFLATQARDPAPHYQHSEIGFNYRLSNISAAIGRGQMQVLETRVTQRRAVYDLYRSELEPRGVFFVDQPQGFFSNRWLSAVAFPKNPHFNEKVRQKLAGLNIESRPLWKPMHLQPVFADSPAYTTGISERLFHSGLCLPSGSNLTQHQQKKIIGALSMLLDSEKYS